MALIAPRFRAPVCARLCLERRPSFLLQKRRAGGGGGGENGTKAPKKKDPPPPRKPAQPPPPPLLSFLPHPDTQMQLTACDLPLAPSHTLTHTHLPPRPETTWAVPSLVVSGLCALALRTTKETYVGPCPFCTNPALSVVIVVVVLNPSDPLAAERTVPAF